MGPITRQAVANVRSRPLQSCLIFATLLISTGLLTLGVIARDSADGAWLELHRQTGQPHLWIHLDDRNVDLDDARTRLASIDGVEEVGPVLRSVELRGLGIEGIFSGIGLREWPHEPGLGQARLVEGRVPGRGPDGREVVLDRNLAVSEGFEVGDVFEIPVTREERIDLEVVGLAATAETCPHPVCNPTYVYTAPGSLAALGLDPPSPAAIADMTAVRLDRPGDAGEVARVIDTTLPAGAVERIDTWDEIREITGVATSFQTLLFGGFGVVTVLLSGVLIVNAVAGAVRAQTRNLGLLKAVGFTGRQLAGVYLLEYLGLASAAAALGATTGAVISGPMLRPVTAQFGVEAAPVAPVELLLVVLAVVALTAVFAAWPVWKVARVDTVAAIRTGADRPRRRGRPLARLPVPIAHGFAELTSRPTRALITGSGLLVTVIALVWVAVTNTTMSSIFENPEVSVYADGDILVLRSGLMPEQDAREQVQLHPDVEAVMAEYWKEFSFQGDAERFQARYLAGDMGAFRPPLIEGRMFTRHGEALAGYGLARDRGLEVGDTTIVKVAGESHEIEVTGIIREFNNLGQMLTMPAETLRRFDPDAGAEIYVVQLEDGARPDALAADIRDTTGGLLGTARLDRSALPKTLRDVQGVILTLSGVMVLTVAVGILSSVSLSVAERRREMGVLKAVGMTPAQVMQSVLVGAATLGVIAVVVGVPIGVALARILSSGVTEGIGLGPMNPVVPLSALAFLVPLVVGMTLAGAAIPARLASRVSPVAALRYE